jgi:type 1 fimbria pilin
MKLISFKIIALFAIMLVSVASFANSGTKLTVDQRATFRMQKVNSVCALTTQQQAQVKQLFVTNFNNRAAIEALRGSNKASWKAAKNSAKQK